MQTWTTKKPALAALRAAKARDESVKLFCRSGVYTQPGRGIVAFCTYYLKAV